ncbi:GspH/FimT family pseudopilin [Psychrobium sp. MM17-31]|uniref:GspH/FimT family pseudopilin n=1 Tax=Psychrobium sp. MM17-31 TaxID=2917758 RepID=UPI001EF69AEF|nr:GspH/FimT family pseudopilin [Psychrobium sp. MM17-31]MCG7530968.1 GspH/FimT family pseudopilin [Psychrobium sp. MM17-31]
MKRSVSGFTIVELMIAMAIVIIVLHLGASSLKEMTLRNHMTTHVNEFVAVQRMARQYALYNKTDVIMCASTDGQKCMAKKYWHEGVLVFVDHNGDRKRDPDDKVIKFFQARAKNLQVTWRAFPNRSYLQYVASGWTNNQNGTFRFCFANEPQHYNRALIITKIGRARLSTDSDGDGFHEDREGKLISCA